LRPISRMEVNLNRLVVISVSFNYSSGVPGEYRVRLTDGWPSAMDTLGQSSEDRVIFQDISPLANPVFLLDLRGMVFPWFTLLVDSGYASIGLKSNQFLNPYHWGGLLGDVFPPSIPVRWGCVSCQPYALDVGICYDGSSLDLAMLRVKNHGIIDESLEDMEKLALETKWVPLSPCTLEQYNARGGLVVNDTTTHEAYFQVRGRINTYGLSTENYVGGRRTLVRPVLGHSLESLWGRIVPISDQN